MQTILRLILTAFGESAQARARTGDRWMEFHVHASLRKTLGVNAPLYRTTGNIVIPDFSAARTLAARIRASGLGEPEDRSRLTAGRLNAMGLIDEVLHLVMRLYRDHARQDALACAAQAAAQAVGQAAYDQCLVDFTRRFPPVDVYSGMASAENWLAGAEQGLSNKELALEECILLKLANENPAFAPFRFLYDDGTRGQPSAAATGRAAPGSLAADTAYLATFAAVEAAFKGMPGFGPDAGGQSERDPEHAAAKAGLGSGFAASKPDLIELLRAPAKASPDSLEGQLRWIVQHWGAEFSDVGARLRTMLGGLDLIAEEDRPYFPPGPGPVAAYDYRSARREYEKFTKDRDWMPQVVMIAKSALVWLHQLSSQYGRPIQRLDQIPEQELDTMASRGINALWLIGIWERSDASRRIKQLCGNPEAAASAYSLYDYEIASDLGGWDALGRLRECCRERGIRLAADMVPNHTGLDSDWIRHRPELFIGADHCPFPGYSFNGPDLSESPDVGLWLEDHYYSRSDAAVVFKRLDKRTGHTRYIYHGNDGTGMAWNDTAQIDFLNRQAREAVKERILHVARHFGIIRFDAAMVLAKQHIRRLWYPAPGSGGAIPSRAEHAMTDAQFDQAIPEEFWREVVDMCAKEAPDTLLLAEAFWMMEGYFVRTLGMHRVYNSAFMNMLKEGKNSLYRKTIKNTQEFDKEILKRWVNFMNNPDEETAKAQFGSGDKYFGVCTMMLCMPGLPMFGHGQIEGFTEKYGMEYRRAYKDESPDQAFIARHEREIFPLARMRYLFAESENFHLFDLIRDDGHIDENVFAWSNGTGDERALCFYNNAWERSQGRIVHSCPWAEKRPDGSSYQRSRSLVQALDISPGPASFVTAREQRSGLRYLFRASDLASPGWRVHLEGYQCKVFLDFDRVQDTDGRYERLYALLGTSGLADFDAGLEEASRPELYHAMNEALEALFECSPQPETDPVQLEGRISTAVQRMETLCGRISLILFEEEGRKPNPSAAKAVKSTLEKSIKTLLSIANSSPKALYPQPAYDASLGLCFALALSPLGADGNPAEELRYILAKFLVTKKLGAYLESRPLSGHSPIDGRAWAALALAFAVRPALASCAACAHKEHKGFARAEELLRWAASDADARIAIGLNTWNGRRYFNKEKMETLLATAPLFAHIEAATMQQDDALDHVARIDATINAIAQAIPASGYDLDLLVAAIATLDTVDPVAAPLQRNIAP